MKKGLRFFIVLSIALLVLLTTVVAQVPQTFNYQGIARDAGGNVLPARKIGVELSVLDGGPAGKVVYSETFTDTTNAFGLFSMQVGGGTVLSGSFAGINWATGNKYLQTSIDLSGGTSYTLSGTTQLLSVPYALYAQTAVVGTSNSSWSLHGNGGTDDTTYIGTTDNSALLFKTGAPPVLSGMIDPEFGNTFFGFQSGSHILAAGNVLTGSANSGIGANALTNNTTGSANAAVGTFAMAGNSTGFGNGALGYGALSGNTTGSFNVALGGSGPSSNLGFIFPALGTNSTGNFNTAIGSGADVSVDGLSNATALGSGAIVTASNMVQIGNTSVTTIQGQVPFTTPSDGRFKFNIREDVQGLDFILKLRPVTYQFNAKKEEDFIRGVRGGGADAGGGPSGGAEPVAYSEAMMVRRTGFIAQEVEKAAKMTGYDFDGLKVPKTEREYYSLSYSSFVVPLVKAVQEQQELIRKQDQKIEEQDQKIEEQDQKIEEQDKTIAELVRQMKELRQLIEAAKSIGTNQTNKP
jgi:trimeric autotransporter adhesin